MAVDRKLLQQALKQGQQTSQRAISGKGFDPRGGIGVLAAQLATAGIGAFEQNRAKKALAEDTANRKASFESKFPQFAGLNFSPETQEAVGLAQAQASIKQQFAAPKGPQSPEGKKAADIKAGLLPEGTSLGKPEDVEKKRETTFKETRDLRKEHTKNSGEFIKQRDAFSRIQASAEDPSAAGDLALIFNYMKLLDPGSTVREGEFATAAQSASLPQTLVARYNKVISGERLEANQRLDFVDRSDRLFGKAKGIQTRRNKQFEGIARRNKLPVEDVILDFIGGIDDPKAKQDIVESFDVEQPAAQAPAQTGGFKILSIK